MKEKLTAYSLQLTVKSFAVLLLAAGCLSVQAGWLFASLSAHAQVNVVTKSIAPNITLLWEAQSYVPPFYKGKALMPDGGDGRVVALLPPETPSPQRMNYVWRINGTVDGARSGIGKSSYEIRSGTFGGSPLVVVEVSDANGDSVGSGIVRIPLAEPQALVYADAPLAGVLFNIEDPRMTGKEVALETYPLFFTTGTRADQNMSYQWDVNNSSVRNPLGNSSRLVLRSESDVGTTTVGVSIANSRKILERASGESFLFLE